MVIKHLQSRYVTRSTQSSHHQVDVNEEEISVQCANLEAHHEDDCGVHNSHHSPLVKKTRRKGPYRMQHVYNRPENTPKIIVPLNDREQPIGGSEFGRVLGALVRDCNLCPIYYASWDLTPKEKKIQMWARIDVIFQLFLFL